MKRGGFSSGWKPKPKEDRVCSILRPIRQIAPPAAKLSVSTPKTQYVRNEDYRRYVASLPCWRCGIEDFSNACHGDSGEDGKGIGIKACDLTCWPGCIDRPGIIGCHSIIGLNTRMSRAEKREIEKRAASDTQAKLVANSNGDGKLRILLLRLGIIDGLAR